MKRFNWASFVAVALALFAAGCMDLDPLPDRPDASTDTDSDTDTDVDTDTDCDGSPLDLASVNVDVLVVLDRTSSLCDQDLWPDASGSVVALTGDMEGQIDFGLMIFPSLLCVGTTNMCSAPADPLVPVGAETADEIALQISGAGDVGCCGAAPTAVTLGAAGQHLDDLGDAQSRYVVLLTDSPPICNSDIVYPDDCTCVGPAYACETDVNNCLDDAETITAAGALEAKGYLVHVVGVGLASDWSDVMNDIASAGGTGAYHYAADAEALAAALGGIAGEVITCELDVDWGSVAAEADPALVNLYDDVGGVIPRDEGCATGEGWNWLDDDTIVLCDLACAQMTGVGWGLITATFGCESQVIGY